MPKGRGRGRQQQQLASDGHANSKAAVGTPDGPIAPAASQAQAELQAPNPTHPAVTEAAAEPHLGLGGARQPPRSRSRGGGSGGAGAATKREADPRYGMANGQDIARIMDALRAADDYGAA